MSENFKMASEITSNNLRGNTISGVDPKSNVGKLGSFFAEAAGINQSTVDNAVKKYKANNNIVQNTGVENKINNTTVSKGVVANNNKTTTKTTSTGSTAYVAASTGKTGTSPFSVATQAKNTKTTGSTKKTTSNVKVSSKEHFERAVDFKNAAIKAEKQGNDKLAKYYYQQVDEELDKYRKTFDEEANKLESGIKTTVSKNTKTTGNNSVSNQAMSMVGSGSTSAFSNGSGVRMNTSNVLQISNEMKKIVKDLDEVFSSVYTDIIQKQNDVWRGYSANKFYKDVLDKTDDIFPECIDKITLYLTSIDEIVEGNIQTGSQLMGDVKNITDPNMEKTINSVATDEVGRAVDQSLLDSVAANGNVQPAVSEVEARGLNMDLLNSVGLSNTITSQVADVNASQVDTALNDSVHTEGAITGETAAADTYFDSREATEVKTEDLFKSSLASTQKQNLISDLAKSISDVKVGGGE